MLFPVPNFENQVFKLRNLTVEQRIRFAQNAGCNRFVWNELISINKKEYEAYQEYIKKVEEAQDDPDKVAKIPKVNCPSLRPNDAANKLPAALGSSNAGSSVRQERLPKVEEEIPKRLLLHSSIL